MATTSLETWILVTHTTHSAGIFIKDVKPEVVENDINKLSGRMVYGPAGARALNFFNNSISQL